jgi:hypothetical protein
MHAALQYTQDQFRGAVPCERGGAERASRGSRRDARLVDGLRDERAPRDREVEAQRKRERAAKRFATA